MVEFIELSFLCLLWITVAFNVVSCTGWLRPLHKHGVVKMCSVEYLTIEIELSVANFQVLDRSQNYRVFNFRAIV